MIIEGSDDTMLHIIKDNNIDKYLVLVHKKVEEGHHKSAKLIADNFQTFSSKSHSIEISGAHYAVSPDVDLLAMFSRISKSRSYRKFHNKALAA